MKKIISKIWVLSLCILLAININITAYGDILDVITDNEQVNDTEQTYTHENLDINDISDTEFQEVRQSSVLTDIDGHWAKDWINNAVKLGFVTGYEDGTFKPDRTITRAEFSKLLNSALKIEISEEVNFSDVKEIDWFYKDIQKSVAAGFFSGYENNTFRPNNPIKREEAAKVVAGAITTGNVDGEGATLLSDYNTIQEWARDSVNTVYNKGYILGYPNGVYMPSRPLTRAEAVKIIYEIVENENIEYGFNITNYNETYSSAVVVGNLKVLDSVGNGNVYIKNVVVLGDIVISARKVNTVELTDVKARKIIVESETNPVKIVFNENVVVASMQVPPIAIVQK